MEEVIRTIGYLCPHCRQSVIADRTEFQLMSGPGAVPCPCGRSQVTLEPTGDQVRLTVPCLFCGKEHSVATSAAAFLRQPALAFSCAASGLDCCYVGQTGPVFEAMKRLEGAADKLEAQAQEKGAFLDELVMHEVLSELKEIAQGGGISCQCGGKEWALAVHYSSIDLTCPRCGGVLRLPAATAEDIEHICCQHSLVIKRKKGSECR